VRGLDREAMVGVIDGSSARGASRDDRGPGNAPARDTDLDDFRALVLIWVLLLHVLYWTGLVAPRWQVAKSWLLFEMPVLFFIAGASNGLGRRKPLGTFYVSRLGRIILPYWVYAVVCLIYEATSVPAPIRRLDGYWLVPAGAPVSPVPFLTWHLWFVPVYLTVMVVFPGLRLAFERFPGWTKMLPLAGLAAVVIGLDDFGVRREFPRHLAFYSFWAFLGLYYPGWKARPWPRGAVVATVAGAYFVLWRLLAHRVYGLDFQWNKFPPNFAFLLLSAGHLGLLSLTAPGVRSVLRRPVVRWLTAPYRSYGYTIYLFHALALRLLASGLERLPALQSWVQGHPVLAVALIFAALAAVTPVLAWPFSFSERGWSKRSAGAGRATAIAPGRVDEAHSVEHGLRRGEGSRESTQGRPAS
jgi:hypothetical protein